MIFAKDDNHATEIVDIAKNVFKPEFENDASDENLMLLRDYCSTINRRYEENVLFGRHLDYFITNFGFAPRKLANDINTAFTQGTLVEYISPSNDNSMRMGLIYCLIGNLQARNKLLEMQRG